MDKPEPRPTGNQWDAYAEQARLQLPAAPSGLIDGYVRWAPWVFIVLGVIGVFFLLIGGLILTGVSLLSFLGGAAGVGAALGALLSVVVGLIIAALGILGGYLMLKQRLTGWWIIAVGMILQALDDVVTLSILGLLITLAIAYVHLHAKPRYS